MLHPRTIGPGSLDGWSAGRTGCRSGNGVRPTCRLRGGRGWLRRRRSDCGGRRRIRRVTAGIEHGTHGAGEVAGPSGQVGKGAGRRRVGLHAEHAVPHRDLDACLFDGAPALRRLGLRDLADDPAVAHLHARVGVLDVLTAQSDGGAPVQTVRGALEVTSDPGHGVGVDVLGVGALHVSTVDGSVLVDDHAGTDVSLAPAGAAVGTLGSDAS